MGININDVIEMRAFISENIGKSCTSEIDLGDKRLKIKTRDGNFDLKPSEWLVMVGNYGYQILSNEEYKKINKK